VKVPSQGPARRPLPGPGRALARGCPDRLQT